MKGFVFTMKGSMEMDEDFDRESAQRAVMASMRKAVEEEDWGEFQLDMKEVEGRSAVDVPAQEWEK